MKQRILFWADAGRNTGYGHFIRSLALADMLREEFDCSIYTREPSEYQTKAAEGVCTLIALPAGEEAENRFLESLCRGDIAVLDNYFFTGEFQLKIKQYGCRLVVTDEMHSRHHYADLLLSPCISLPEKFDLEKNASVLSGHRWAMLRKPFLARTVGNVRNGTVVCFGGSDPFGLSASFAENLRNQGPVTVITGDGFSGIIPDGVRHLSRLDAEEMAGLFSNAEKVYCSASTVCYEALACGAEVFAGYCIDNQKEFYESLCAASLIHPLGQLPGEVVRDAEVSGRISFYDIPARYREVFRSLSLEWEDYTELNDEMSRKVWESRNLPQTRQWMTGTEAFSFESHQRFIDKLRTDSSRRYFAFHDGKNFVGSCDFVNIEGDTAERGIFMDPSAIGKGLAHGIDLLSEGIMSRYGIRKLKAEVKNDNVRSVRYHLSAGYLKIGGNGEYTFFEKEII